MSREVPRLSRGRGDGVLLRHQHAITAARHRRVEGGTSALLHAALFRRAEEGAREAPLFFKEVQELQ